MANIWIEIFCTRALHLSLESWVCIRCFAVDNEIAGKVEWTEWMMKLLMCHLERRPSMHISRSQRVGAQTHSNDTMAGAISETWQFIIIIVLILSCIFCGCNERATQTSRVIFVTVCLFFVSIKRRIYMLQSVVFLLYSFLLFSKYFLQTLEKRALAGRTSFAIDAAVVGLCFAKKDVRSTLNVLSTCLL